MSDEKEATFKNQATEKRDLIRLSIDKPTEVHGKLMLIKLVHLNLPGKTAFGVPEFVMVMAYERTDDEKRSGWTWTTVDPTQNLETCVKINALVGMEEWIWADIVDMSSEIILQ